MYLSSVAKFLSFMRTCTVIFVLLYLLISFSEEVKSLLAEKHSGHGGSAALQLFASGPSGLASGHDGTAAGTNRCPGTMHHLITCFFNS
jgi:hypothetical protein